MYYKPLVFYFLLTLLFCFAVDKAQSQAQAQSKDSVVSKVSNAPLEGTLLKSPDKYTFIIGKSGKRSSLSKKAVKSFLLDKPLRLVIDVSGQKVGGLKQVSVKDDIVSALRIGAQKNNARAVVEMKSNKTPVYSIQEKAGKLVFTIRFPNSLEPTSTEEHEEEAVAETVVEQTTTTVTTTTTTEAPTTTTTVSAPSITSTTTTTSTIPRTTTTTEINKPINPAAGIVNRLYFQITKNTSDSALVLEVTNLSKYSLSQKDSTRFEIILEQMQLAGRHVELPQFPPDTFGGFQVVTARSDGQNVLVNIYVDEGTKLLPYVAGGKLWVKTSK